jgi:DNA-directed RNA polymerase specialized sigma24 family protein
MVDDWRSIRAVGLGDVGSKPVVESAMVSAEAKGFGVRLSPGVATPTADSGELGFDRRRGPTSADPLSAPVDIAGQAPPGWWRDFSLIPLRISPTLGKRFYLCGLGSPWIGDSRGMANASSSESERRIGAEAARFYGDIYQAARSGCLAELRHVGCSEEEAEEFFAATMEKVMRSVDPITRRFSAAQMVAFLKGAAVRTLIDGRRHQSLLSQVAFDDVAGVATDPGARSPDEVVEDHEVVAIGREAIGTLGRRDRQVFGLRNSLGLSPREVLEHLPGLSRRSYRRRIERSNARVSAAFDKIVDGRRCGEVQALLRAVAIGTSESRAVEEIELHIAHCAGCRRTLARLSRCRRRHEPRDDPAGRSAV